MHAIPNPRLGGRGVAVARLCRGLLVAGLLPAAIGWGHGAFHERFHELAAALAAQPRDASLHFALARLYCQHEDWLPALAAADTADELRPGGFATDLVRGEAELGRGQPERAEAALTRFLAMHPASAPARVWRARARLARADTPGALADFRAVLWRDARPDCDHVREAAAALAGQGCAAEAADALGRAIGEFGPDPALLGQALEVEVSVGRFAAALARVDALQAAAPRPEPWMARRAVILTQAGEVAAARAAWRALQQHLAALPNLERGSPPLRSLAEQARAALDAPAP